MAKFRKKPVVIEAIQFLETVERIKELSDFMGMETFVNYENPEKPII